MCFTSSIPSEDHKETCPHRRCQCSHWLSMLLNCLCHWDLAFLICMCCQKDVYKDLREPLWYFYFYFCPTCHLISLTDYRREEKLGFCLVLCILAQKKKGVKFWWVIFKFTYHHMAIIVWARSQFVWLDIVCDCWHAAAWCAACCNFTFWVFHTESPSSKQDLGWRCKLRAGGTSDLFGWGR